MKMSNKASVQQSMGGEIKELEILYRKERMLPWNLFYKVSGIWNEVGKCSL